MFPSYAELHCLTNFSFLRGASHPEELVERAAKLGYSAIAITDECSLAGVVRAHVAAKEARIELIVGTEVVIEARGAPSPPLRAPSPQPSAPLRGGEGELCAGGNDIPSPPLHGEEGMRLVLLATDRDGYGNLSALITRARRRSHKGEYRLDAADLDDGLPGCLALLLPGAAPEQAHAHWIKARFEGRCWVAVELHAGPDDRARLAQLEAYAQQAGLPLVAAGDVHMHVRSRRALQDTLTAVRLRQPIAQCGHALFPNGERYLRPRERLARIYPPELLIATLDVAQRCSFSLDSLRYEYPEEIVPTGQTPASWLRKLAEDGFRWRFGAALCEARGGAEASGERQEARGTPSPQPSPPHTLTLPSPATLTLPSPALRERDLLVALRAAKGRERDLLVPLRGGGEGEVLPSCPRRGGSEAAGVVGGHPPLASCLSPSASPLRAAPGWGGHFTSARDTDIDKARALVEHELALIAELRYEPYFLTVYDIVKFAREQGILCQGRGSAANSAVCYCLGITEVDPARMDMLFERFISRERNEPPDIDVDFEHERREEVIQYIYRKYGRDRAALAATVITYRPKSALRDVGKALGLDLAQVDRLSKSTAWWDGRKVRAERLREAGFDPDAPVIQRLTALVNIVVGFPRHLSQHVGGFVVSRGPLSRLVPIENAAMIDRTVIQWDKDDLDALGLLKVDVLALGMLTAIRRALKMVGERRGRPFSMSDVPAEDPGVYEMVSRADTIGVFQIESRAQQAMLPRMRPRCFYDLVIEVAIVRPGPIQGGMVHPYLRRRQGLEPVTYPSDDVRKVLERTLGVPIFQEQVMQLAVVAAGFTPGEADKLRRAMAAWRRKGGLEPFEQRLKDGMRARGYPEQFAEQIYRQILGFGEYGFPESHSASFALLVYVSCWLKRYEPAAFTCALLNSQPMGFYAPAQLVQDAQRHGVEVLPPDVLVSGWDCALEACSAPLGAPSPRPSPPLRGGEGELCAGGNDTPSPPHTLTLPSPATLTLPSPALRERDLLVALRAAKGRERDLLVPLRGGGEGWGEGGNEARAPAIRLGLRMVKGFSQAAAERLVAAREQWLAASTCTLLPHEGIPPTHTTPPPYGGTPPRERRGQVLSPPFQGAVAPEATGWFDVPVHTTPPPDGGTPPRERRGQVLCPPFQGGMAPEATGRLDFEALAHAARLNRHDVNALAAAGALASVAGHRRQAVWTVTGIEPRPPVLRGTPIVEAAPRLAAPTEGEDMVADYASLGLTLGRHPVALLRPRLSKLSMLTAAQLRELPHGKLARAAGIVIGRQRPDTASGVIFVTLEDETGMVNVVVWRTVAEQQRRPLLGSHLLAVHGTIERQGEVVHLVAGKLVDHSALLGRLIARSRDFH